MKAGQGLKKSLATQKRRRKMTHIHTNMCKNPNPLCKNQKHIDMLEKFYDNIVESLKRAASEVLTNSPKQKHNAPGWNKDVREKHKAARQAYLYWIDNHKPKSGPLFDIMKNVKKSSNMH